MGTSAKLVQGVGVLEFPWLLFLGIGSLFEHRSAAGFSTQQASYRRGGVDSAIP